MLRFDESSVGLEMMRTKNVPVGIMDGYLIDSVWKATSSNRIEMALYHKILGHSHCGYHARCMYACQPACRSLNTCRWKLSRACCRSC
jgi:hypothetical protein